MQKQFYLDTTYLSLLRSHQFNGKNKHFWAFTFLLHLYSTRSDCLILSTSHCLIPSTTLTRVKSRPATMLWSLFLPPLATNICKFWKHIFHFVRTPSRSLTPIHCSNFSNIYISSFILYCNSFLGWRVYSKRSLSWEWLCYSLPCLSMFSLNICSYQRSFLALYLSFLHPPSHQMCQYPIVSSTWSPSTC